jgi:hypothetical protein
MSNHFRTIYTENNYRIPHEHRQYWWHTWSLHPVNLFWKHDEKVINYPDYTVHIALRPYTPLVFCCLSTGATFITPRFGDSHALVIEYCWNLKWLAPEWKLNTVYETCDLVATLFHQLPAKHLISSLTRPSLWLGDTQAQFISSFRQKWLSFDEWKQFSSDQCHCNAGPTTAKSEGLRVCLSATIVILSVCDNLILGVY